MTALHATALADRAADNLGVITILALFALTVGWLWQWGQRHNTATQTRRQRRNIMRRLTWVRNHERRGQW